MWHEADATHTNNEEYNPNGTYNNNEWPYHVLFAHDNVSIAPDLSDDNLVQSADDLLHSELISLQVRDIMGKEFISITDAEKFYKKYSYGMGFSMRKDRLKLYEFISHIDRAISLLRNNELKDDFDNINEHPVLVTHLLQLEKYVVEVYTRNTFAWVQDEIKSEAKLSIVNCVDDMESVMYTFKKFAGGDKTWNVRYGALGSKCSKMSYYASMSTEGYKEANVAIDKLKIQMKGLLPSSSTAREENVHRTKTQSSVQVKDPVIAATKGLMRQNKKSSGNVRKCGNYG
ncbi:hypothetical protein LWI29_022749 [Acer saccharum]|uniref:Protein FAR1-RELATED SEQUENCE n=1 Tax=Acer saccharum TaxID=4024 RepID=A0AA39RXE0_ACESA|nr:hypothetical protein LWI29_022749 [Acer saccharum]